MSPKKSGETKKSPNSSTKKKPVAVKNNSYINPQNYLYALLILVGGILLALIIFGWYNMKKEEKLMTSYLVASNTIKSSIDDINYLDQIRQETPSDYFIYIGYTKDEDVYNFEKELKVIIDKYKLNDIFYYVDVTESKENNANYLQDINKVLDTQDIQNIPAIVYISDGNIESILDGINDTKLKVADFEKLLDTYDYDVIK